MVCCEGVLQLDQANVALVILVSKLNIRTQVLRHGQNACKSRPWKIRSEIKLRCRDWDLEEHQLSERENISYV